MKRILALVMLLPFFAGACMAGMCGMGHESRAAGSDVSTPPPARPAPDPNFDTARTRRLLEAYNQIIVALADDELGGVGEAASLIVNDAPNDAIRNAAESMVGTEESKDIAESREHFKTLSAAVARYAAGNHESLEAGFEKDEQPVPQTAYCPMADAVWLQYGDKITNPYYGKSMLRCGEFQDWPEPAKEETTKHQH